MPKSTLKIKIDLEKLFQISNNFNKYVILKIMLDRRVPMRKTEIMEEYISRHRIGRTTILYSIDTLCKEGALVFDDGKFHLDPDLIDEVREVRNI
jgi:hypothetical protein